MNKEICKEAIYSTLESMACEHVLIDLTKEDAKDIYNSLQKQLPLFSY